MGDAEIDTNFQLEYLQVNNDDQRNDAPVPKLRKEHSLPRGETLKSKVD